VKCFSFKCFISRPVTRTKEAGNQKLSYCSLNADGDTSSNEKLTFALRSVEI
jgi:hypothetical protein